jgi:hypothetical protein
MLQLALLGGRPSCDLHAHETLRAATHAGHRAHGASLVTVPVDTCGAEHDPGACASMASCAVTLSLPELVAANVAPTQPAGELPDAVPIGSRRAAGPDVPPPRG